MTPEGRVTARLLSSGLLNFGAGVLSSFLISWYFTPDQAKAQVANVWWFIFLLTSLVLCGWGAYVLAHRAER
jgi:hypothetical protein